MTINQARFSLDPEGAPPGWKLIENTAIYLSPTSTTRFVQTHSKACGLVGLLRILYDVLCFLVDYMYVFGLDLFFISNQLVLCLPLCIIIIIG